MTEQERINRRRVVANAIGEYLCAMAKRRVVISANADDGDLSLLDVLDMALEVEEAIYQDEEESNVGPRCTCELRHSYSPAPEMFGRAERDHFELSRACEIHRGRERYSGGLDGLLELAQRDDALASAIIEAGLGGYLARGSEP